MRSWHTNKCYIISFSGKAHLSSRFLLDDGWLYAIKDKRGKQKIGYGPYVWSRVYRNSISNYIFLCLSLDYITKKRGGGDCFAWAPFTGQWNTDTIYVGEIGYANSHNCFQHKNYNFLACDWFKNVLFFTNSLAKLFSDSLLLDSLLSESLISQSHSKM